MTLIEYIARIAIYARFGKSSTEADIITDYLDPDVPDWRGAWRAFRTFHGIRRNRGKVA